MNAGGSYGNLSDQDQEEMNAALRAMGSPTSPRECLGLRPEGIHAPARGEIVVKSGEWLTRNHVPEETDGRLSPATHEEKRDHCLRLITEARQRGIPRFHLGTGEELTDDHDHYLVWEPGPNWDRGLWRRLLGEQEALNYRARVTDELGRVWRGSTPASWEEEVRPSGGGAARQAPPPAGF